MRTTLYYISAFLTYLLVVFASIADSDLIKLVQSQGSNKVIELNDGNYKEVLTGPRDYHAVVMFSSDSSQFNCVLCREFKPDYEITANSWYREHPKGLLKEQEAKLETPRKNIYFFYTDFMNSKELFLQFKLNNIPKVFYFPPTEKSGNAYLNEFDEYQFYQGVHRELLMSYLFQTTGLKINLYVPPNYSRIAINAAIVLAVLFVAKRFQSTVGKFLSSRALWGEASLVLVLLLTTGYMFNQIRGVPYLQGEGKAMKDFFLPSQQSQLGIETQIVSFIYGMLSLFTIFLIKRAPEIKNHKANFVATLIACVFIYNFYGLLLYVFGLKGMGYPYRFFKA